jgi:CheY-like chemotaxis protein
MMQQEPPILIVDDDPAILETVSDILSEEGYPVARTANSLEGLEMAERLAPALILLDMRMPQLDGWEFARRLRARGLATPIIVMTAAQDAGGWASEIDAAGVLSKPFDLLDLLHVVERLYRRSPA